MALQGKCGPAPKKAAVPQGGYPGTGNPAKSDVRQGTASGTKGTPGQKTWPSKKS